MPKKSLAALAAATALGGAVVLAAPAPHDHVDDDHHHHDLATDHTHSVSTTTTTTVPPTTTTTVPPTTTTTVPPTGDAAFIETFDGNSGLDRFRTAVEHRNLINGFTNGHSDATWTADHDLACGLPDTQRVISSPDQVADTELYLCRNHLMTTMGDVDGYSIVWFSPDQTFDAETTVSWDVNVTDLGNRQWWEVAILPADAPDVVCDVSACDPTWAHYTDVPGALVFGNGRFGGGFKWSAVDEGVQSQNLGTVAALDPNGYASKVLRRSFSLNDQGDGTILLGSNIEGLDGRVLAGSFPDGPYKVVFKDHNYTPDKAPTCRDRDDVCPGYTWHWDNIAVR